MTDSESKDRTEVRLEALRRMKQAAEAWISGCFAVMGFPLWLCSRCRWRGARWLGIVLMLPWMPIALLVSFALAPAALAECVVEELSDRLWRRMR